MNAQHTPTPWKVEIGTHSSSVKGPDGESLFQYPRSKAEARANAAYIVRAVNAHDELLQAVKDLIEAMHNGPERILREDEIEAIIHGRTAIAKAEGI